MPVDKAVEFGSTVGQKTKWNKQTTAYTKGEAMANRELYMELQDALEKTTPEIRAATKEMGGMVPVQQAAEKRSGISAGFSPLGLIDANLVPGGKAGMLAAATRKGLTTTGGARGLRDLGETLQRPGPSRQLLLRQLRSASASEED